MLKHDYELFNQEEQNQLTNQFALVPADNDNKSILSSYFGTRTKDAKETKVNPISETQKIFIASVLMAMAKILGNLGLFGDANGSSSEFLEKEYQDEEDYLKDISAFRSKTGEGLLSKFLPFSGDSSVLTFTLQSIEIANNNKPITESLLRTIQHLLSTQALPFGLLAESMILPFIASGIAVMTAATLIYKVRKNQLVKRKQEDLKKYAGKDWKESARPNDTCLMQSYKDVRSIIKQFYSDYHDENPYSGDKNKAETTIKEEIIVPEPVNPAIRYFKKIGNEKGDNGSGEGG